MPEYILINSTDPDTLINAINQKVVDEGLRLVGPVMAVGVNRVLWYATMVREEP